MFKAALLLFLLRPGLCHADVSALWSPSGLWHRVTGAGCVTPHSGTGCVYYGIDSSCTYANGQVQDASLTTLAPVPMTASNATMSFWLLYGVQSVDPLCQDRLLLEYSADGSTWYKADILTTQTEPTGGSPTEVFASGSGLGGPPLWQFVTITNIGLFAPSSDYWRFRYVSSGEEAGDPTCGPPDLYQNFLGFAIDDVNIGVAPPDLAISKNVSPAFGAPGDTFTFNLNVTNTASSAATLDVADTLPPGYTLVGSNPPATESGSTVEWSSLSAAPSQGFSLQLMVQPPASAAVPDDWINTATATSSLTTTAVSSSQVLVKLRAPVVALTKSVSPTQLTSGDTATYSLVVENDSPVTQSALTLTDDVPAAFSATQAWPSEPTTTPNGDFTWNLSLVPGQIQCYTLSGPVVGQNGQVVVNSAQITGSTTTAQATASLTVNSPVKPTVSIQAIFPNPAPSHGAGQPQEAFVAYRLSMAMPVTLDIYDVAGEKVRSLSAPGNQGLQQMAWDLKNSYGLAVASGVYVLRLYSPGQAEAQATGYLAVRQ